LKVLLVSHLWPRTDFPFLGIFVADQTAALRKWCDIQVCSPVDLIFRSEELSLAQILAGCPKFRRRINPDLVGEEGNKLQITKYRSWAFRRTFAAGTALSLARALNKIDLTGVDLVHAHTLFPDGLGCAHWLRDKSTPLVVTAHGSDLHSISSGVQRAMRPLLERADQFIAVSDSLRDQLVKLGAEARKISVLPNGFNSGLFPEPVAADNRGKRLVFLGQPRPVKRVDLLIRALTYCPEDVSLDIAGESGLVSSLKSLTKQLNLEPRVRFLGTVPREQVPQLLANAALLCLVSSREGWPTVIFEAFACGTPVLATAVGGIPEALAGTDLGVLVSPEIEPIKLAEAICVALEQPWDHAAIRRHALDFSWEAIAETIYQIYQKVTGQYNVSPAAVTLPGEP
jgi:teichuronic acid biosynthesis glycosyltransferase TuaC